VRTRRASLLLSTIDSPATAEIRQEDTKAELEGLEQGMEGPVGSRSEDHEDEGRATHLAHKAEHAVDVESGAIVAVTVQDASIGDTGTIMDTLAEAEGQLAKLQRKAALERLVQGLQGVVADKGYHSDDVLVRLEDVGYVSEPDRGRRRWRGDDLAQRAVSANRRRGRGERGQRLQRMRGERVERSFAHLEPRQLLLPVRDNSTCRFRPGGRRRLRRPRSLPLRGESVAPRVVATLEGRRVADGLQRRTASDGGTRPDPRAQDAPDEMKRLATLSVVASSAPQVRRAQGAGGRLAVDHIGMDLGKKESQVAIITEAGELIEQRIRTERVRLEEVFGSRPKARILIEAGVVSHVIP
jgi:hypothetical protein